MKGRLIQKRMQGLRLWRLFCLFCVSSLSGCLYYGDIHGNSKPLCVTNLNKSHVLTIPPPHVAHCSCWNQFKDPQLTRLISVALRGSPDMHIAESRVRRARALVDGAVAPLWPAIDFSGYLQRHRFAEFGLVPPPFNGKVFNIGDLALNLNYDFDFWGRNREALAASVSEKCATEADYAESRLIISAAVASNYFQLLATIKQEKLAELNWRKTKEISDIIVDRVSNGIDSDIPLKTALANVQEARLSMERFKASEKLLRNQLAVLLGNNPFTTKIMTMPFKYRSHHITLPSNLTVNILARRPDIYAAKSRAQAAAHQINVAKAGFFPNFHLNGLFSYQSVFLGKLFEPGSQENAIIGAVDLPLFDAGARRANLGVKYAEYDVAVNQYNKTILNALREVADQQATLKSLSVQIHSQTDALRANSHNYKLFNSRYKHGIIDYVPVIELKQLLLQEQATQIDLQAQHLVAVVAMLKALGGCTQETYDNINHRYTKI